MAGCHLNSSHTIARHFYDDTFAVLAILVVIVDKILLNFPEILLSEIRECLYQHQILSFLLIFYLFASLEEMQVLSQSLLGVQFF